MPKRSLEATLSVGYAAFNLRDAEQLRELMVGDFIWNEAEGVPGRKQCESADEFTEYMMGFDLLWEEFSFEPVLLKPAGDDTVVAHVTGHGRGRSGGKPIEIEIHHVWRFREGKVARMDAYLDPRDAAEAAKAPPPPPS